MKKSRNVCGAGPQVALPNLVWKRSLAVQQYTVLRSTHNFVHWMFIIGTNYRLAVPDTLTESTYLIRQNCMDSAALSEGRVANFLQYSTGSWQPLEPRQDQMVLPIRSELEASLAAMRMCMRLTDCNGGLVKSLQ